VVRARAHRQTHAHTHKHTQGSLAIGQTVAEGENESFTALFVMAMVETCKRKCRTRYGGVGGKRRRRRRRRREKKMRISMRWV